eukprot:GGOE01019377.1.p1 GENE.GGOE01019377.1~~GGOE01019377.1.p1  ORF type:complete len:636 (-),score=214.61 GGOE01019377.1:263-2170(-)
MSDFASNSERVDDEKEIGEDLENISLDELKAKYLRYRRRTDEWKEKMKAIATKERAQLTMTTNQLRQNTKVLRETTERLEVREKEFVQVEKEKKDLEQQVQELNKTILVLNAEASRRQDVSREKLAEEMSEELSRKMDLTFRSKLLQVETHYKQQIGELRNTHAMDVDQLKHDLTITQQQLDHLQQKHDHLLAKAQGQLPAHEQALAVDQGDGPERETDREAQTRIRDLEARVALLEKEKARLVEEYEQYKVRSQAAFKKSKAEERELYQQRQMAKLLQQQLQLLQAGDGTPRIEVGGTLTSPLVSQEGDGGLRDAALSSWDGPSTVEELQHRLRAMEAVCLEADQKLNEVTERLEIDSESHREEVRQLQEEMQQLQGHASRAQQHFQEELRNMDAQLGREVTRLQGAVKAKAAIVEALCERLGIDESQLRDGLPGLGPPISPLPSLSTQSLAGQSLPTSPCYRGGPFDSLTLDPLQSHESLSAADLDLSVTNVGQTAFIFDFQSLVSIPAADPNVQVHHLSEYKESQLKRLAADLEASRAEVKALQDRVHHLEHQEQRHQEVERMLRDDVRQLQMTTYTEETWVEKRNYIKNIVLKFIQARHNEEVQAQLVPVISMVLAFTPIELQMVQRSFKK